MEPRDSKGMTKMISSRVVLLSVRMATLLMVAIGLLAATGEAAVRTLTGVRSSVGPGSATLFVRLSAPARFNSEWVDSNTFALDFPDFSTSLRSEEQAVHSPLVAAYRVFSYVGSDDTPHVRVELALKAGAKAESERAQGGVAIRIHPNGAPAVPPDKQPSQAPSAKAKTIPNLPVASDVKAGTAIREVQVAKIEGSSVLEIQVVGNGALEYRTLRLTNPERLVLDIPNTRNRIRQKQLPVNAAPLRDVRIGQLSQRPLVSRVVMDLDSKTPFQVRRQANSLVVTLGESLAKEVPERNNAVPAESPELSPEKLNGRKPPENPEAAMMAPGTAVDLLSTESAKPAQLGFPDAASDQPAPAPGDAPGTDIASAPASVDSGTALKENPAAEAAVAATVQPATATRAVESPAPLEAAPVKLENSSAAQEPMPAPEQVRISPPEPASLIAKNEPVAASKVQASAPVPDPRPVSHEAKPAPVVSAAPTAKSGNQTEVASKQIVVAAAPNPDALLAQAAPPAAPAQAPAAKPAYSGEPISVNLKDVDLKDFFRLIHEISGLNVVLDPSVAGAVTIVLDEVPWDQAMEIVMRNNGLGKEVEGNVVRIAKLATIEAEEKQRRDLALAVDAAQPKVTVTRQLSYAKGADLIVTLKKFLSERGDVIADARTNTLIITDIPGAISQVDGLIKSLDQKSLQVEIEARVVSASRSFARDIGTQLAASGLTGNVVLGGAGGVGTSPIKRGTAPPLFVGTPPAPAQAGQPPIFADVAQPLNVNLGAAAATSGFSILLTNGSTLALDAIITAAESRGVGKLLSRPKIITQNNVEATVQQGVKIPIQTTINNTVSVQYVNVVLRLTVTPQITADGTIFLKTDIENSSIDPGIATIPGQFGLDTQSATTQVLVSNGGTVFFGGVIQDVNRISQQQVPLLGSVPLIGNIFKRKQTTSTTNELLFFITPRIVQS
jgi:type IV pilus secretin PilQ/predicted competence protein